LSEKSGDRLRTARSDDRHHKAPTGGTHKTRARWLATECTRVVDRL
jgi:hypothetical protein